ncbi:uncharacterized protein LOC113365965 [Ctenocephalides felis]|uniref:uncharacterized protein LOC113365965 n=1 Tax=Ctenocephalides felis TaxID=7515 RepID=UPI000E6E4D70|nr:uncharacterized protein LOC113365965 [Ctenocephalides felis]
MEKIFKVDDDNLNEFKFIFTDGSKYKNMAGCAVFQENLKIKLGYKFPDFVSVFTTELIAIKKALELIKRYNFQKAIIFTDNKSCIAKLQNLFYTTKLLDAEYYVIWNNIARLVEGGHNVKLLWVKAHSGIVGNELAKRASEHGPEVKVAMYKDFLNKVSQRINMEWQKDWDVSSQTRGQYYKRIKPVVNKKLWQEQFKEEDRRV